jgi:hypothetical protein
LFFLAVGSIGAIGGWGAYIRDTEIVRTGTKAEARILRKSVVQDVEAGNEYVVRYWFETSEGHRVEGRAYVPKRIWNGLRVGAPLTVIYAPENPRRSFPEGGGVTSLGMVVVVSALFGAIAVMGGALIAGYFRGNEVET